MQTTIREATGTLARTGPGRIRVRIIDEGTGSSGTYTREVLEKAATERAFPRGTQMHLDHSTPGDLMERPEGSLRNLVGVLDEDARYEDGALVAEARIGSAWRSFVDDFGEFIGVSISAAAEISEADTGRVVERIIPDRMNRADLVTVAGRGGRIEAVLEAATRAAEEAATTDPHNSPTNPAGETTKKEDASMADTNLTEALTRASEADRRANEAEAKAAELAAERDRLAQENTALKEAAEAAAKTMRERALADARAIVAESFGENAPAFIVRAAESAATGEDFDPDTLRTEVTEAAAALTVDPATPSVGAYTITVNESDLGRMSAAEIAARINDHYFKG